MKNKIFVFVFVLIFVFSFSLTSFAQSFSAYSSVTPSTSQIAILINSLQNQPDFSIFKDWVALRTGDYDFSLFYNIDPQTGFAKRLRYYATSSGYSTIWHFSRSDVSQFSYNPGDFTIVGTVYDSLGSEVYNSFLRGYLFKFTVPFILVLLIVFLFRIRKRGVIQL